MLSAHCPDGLTPAAWRAALSEYVRLKAAGQPMGQVLRQTGDRAAAARRGVAANLGTRGVVASWLPQKRFGFVQDERGRRVFFHRSVAAVGWAVQQGDPVTFELGTDKQGRPECTAVKPTEAGGSAQQGGEAGLPMRAFSMNMPFAALVAHGYKTTESRNHTMFSELAGETVLLHVGQRTYPDGGKHVEIMRDNGASDAEIARLTSLPAGMSRGNLVALVTLGETRLVEPEAARCTPEIERRCCATGGAMGRYLTDVVKTKWLAQPVPGRGKPGMFDVRVPEGSLPQGVARAPPLDGEVVTDMEF